jgi:hypothetical protein
MDSGSGLGAPGADVAADAADPIFKERRGRKDALASQRPVMPRAMRGIQYAAASRFYDYRLWNTGSPAFAGDDG